MKLAELRHLVHALKARQPVAMVVHTDDAQPSAHRTTDHPDYQAASQQAGFDKHQITQLDATTYVRSYHPGLRLYIIGAVHIAHFLAPMAAQLGYHPIIIDPRGLFGHAERWAGFEVHHEYPDDVFEQLPVDARSAVVALSHDPKIDDPGLAAALQSKAFYVGALGSSRNHQKRLIRLQEQGFGAEQLQRIHGPIGLSIGATNPAEIAISILAQMTAALRLQPDTRP